MIRGGGAFATMSVREYHLEELKAARTAGHPSRVMPDIPVTCRSILDVGCGAGQTLIASELPPHCFLCGIDVDFEALALGRELAPNICFVQGKGELLPFREGSFDMVISRVALPLMHIPSALTEMSRVLSPGGRIWLVLHPFRMVLKQLLNSARRLRYRDVIFRFYVIANGVALHFSGKQFRYPFNRSYCESFQTCAGLRRALESANFGNIELHKGKFFIATAVELPTRS